MAFINYYKELGLEETSSLEEVKKSIKTNRKRYRQLTGSPNIDQRSMAERKMEIISQAEKVFENESTKKAYDEELAREKQNTSTTTVPTFDNGNDVVDYFRYARDAYREGNNTLAMSYADEALKFVRTNADLWGFKGRLCYEAKDYNNAELAASEAYRLNPKNADFLELKGHIEMARGNVDAALSNYQQAFKQSQNVYYLVLKGQLLFNKGYYQKTIKELTYIVNNHFEESKPYISYIYECLSKSYSNEDGYDNALKYAEKLIAVSSDMAAHFWYVQTLAVTDPDKANSFLDGMKEKFGDNDDFYQEYTTVLLIIFQALLTLKCEDTSLENALGKIFGRNVQRKPLIIDNSAKATLLQVFIERVNRERLKEKYILKETRSMIEAMERELEYATTRHFTSSGCFPVVLLFICNWFLSAFIGIFNQSFFMSNIISLAILSMLFSYFFYPKGYQLNRRKKV